MQTKKQSFIETISSTAIGFIVSLAATFVIFPLVNVATTPTKNIGITIFFTVISILRGYLIRRLFNKQKTIQLPETELQAIQHQKLEGFPLVEMAKLPCFDCETETPVKYNKGKYYCANCGLKH